MIEQQSVKLAEVRCRQCNKLLCKAANVTGRVEIMCARCKQINVIKK